MNLNVKSEDMEAFVTKAIYDGMSEEVRQDLIKQALTSLIAAPRNTGNAYSAQQGPSVLQEAFNRAAENVANQIASARLREDPEFAAKIEALFRDVAKKLFEGSLKEALVDKICNLVIKGLGDRYS